MQGGFVKARYKPTNRIEFHEWNEGKFGYEEKYVSDILFSSDLSFIPVDLRFGPLTTWDGVLWDGPRLRKSLWRSRAFT